MKHPSAHISAGFALADYPAMSFFFVCWHSRKWWPPIRGGTLQMLVLWPEKLNQIDYFCKSGILYAWGGPRSIERCKKHGAPPKKIVFPGLSVIFSVCPEKLQQPIRTKWFWPEKLQQPIRPNWFWPEKLQLVLDSVFCKKYSAIDNGSFWYLLGFTKSK